MKSPLETVESQVDAQDHPSPRGPAPLAGRAGSAVGAARPSGGAARPSAAQQFPAGRRRRNPRGQGARLTEDIVSGAIALIEREGTGEAVTLRAVAREVGIAAPSIYAHFPDREAILMAVVARIFDELTAAIRQGIEDTGEDPVDRLVAGCRAYVAFGLEHPARYGVLFSAHRSATEDYCKPVSLGPDGLPVLEFGAESFALLATAIGDCVKAGASASTDIVADGTAVWVAMHGTVSLRTALPGFPWPGLDEFVRGFVLSLAHVR
jgi:AcrR family transcriptional regulator